MRTLRRDLFVAFLAIATFVALVPILTYVIFARNLSPREALVSSNDRGVKLLDIKERPYFTFYEAKFKKEIPLSQIPEHTQEAMIAMEDARFYTHPGFSIPAIFRSFYENVRGQSLSYGASTITQQLIKNSLLNPRKDVLRKTQEIILAQEVERRYSKKEILEMYLNSVYFGEGAFGVEEAARVYFNKPAEQLTLAESSILTAILPAPTRMSLINGNLEEAKFRQRIVLERMQGLGYITAEEREAALAEEIEINPEPTNINAYAPHFALMIRDQLVEKYGEEWIAKSGIKVKTTLDLDWQQYAEEAVAKQVQSLKGNNVSNGAAVVMDPKTSEVRALVGSTNWYDESFGKVNIALAERPPGSAFKPIVYIRALEKGLITTATILRDEPTSFTNFDEEKFYASFPSRAAAQASLARDPNAFYKPVNYDRRFRGPVTVRRALANSLNVPSVAVMKKVGLEEALDSAKNLGLSNLKDPSNYGLSLVLGAAEVKLLELTNAYAVFANKGYYNQPVLIREIIDKRGDIIFQHQPEPKSVVDEKYTFLISSILSDNKTRAEVFGPALNISRPAAVKTGTTEDFKDAWTLGYTPGLVVGVWIGNNFNQPMSGVAGSLGAAPIWRNLMEKFSADTPVEEFTPPEGVTRLTTNCALDLSSKIASRSAATDYFVEGTVPKNCPVSTPAPLPVSPNQLRRTIDPRPETPREEPRQDNSGPGSGGQDDGGRNGGGNGNSGPG